MKRASGAEASARGPRHPFEAPSHELDVPMEWGPMLGFLWQRTLRMAVAALVVVTLGYVLLPMEVTLPVLMGLVTLGVMLYLPTTLVLFRTRFLPRPPELDELLLDTGEQAHGGDYLAAVRAHAAEQLLGTLPLTLLAVYAVVRAGLPGLAVGLACLLLVAANLGRTAVRTSLAVSSVDLARERPDRALQRLAPLVRLPLPRAMADELWHQVAIVQFRRGAVQPMLAALDRVREPEVWGVPLLRAQAVLGQGGVDEARAALAAADPELVEAHEALDALVALHTGEIERVRAHAERWEQEREEVPAFQARFRDLVLAAALADAAPDRARALLQRSRWTTDRLPWLRAVWPAVAGRLEPLAPW